MDIMHPLAVIGTNDIFISAKYTPFSSYKPGCVRIVLEESMLVAPRIKTNGSIMKLIQGQDNGNGSV